MEYDGATGWLVGPEHGGMAAMFTMMNNARLGVGVQGIGAAEGAYQHALAYAMDRKQGKAAGTARSSNTPMCAACWLDEGGYLCRPRHCADECSGD